MAKNSGWFDSRIAATLVTAWAILAGATIVAATISRLSPRQQQGSVMEAAPQAALAQVASAIRAKVDPKADERGALSMLLRVAGAVRQVASRAVFIEAVIEGFATELGGAPVDLTKDAIRAIAGWLWDLSDGGSGTTVIERLAERYMTRETVVRESQVERHYMPAELRVAFTVLFTKPKGWSGPDIDAQMQAFAEAWRHEVVNRDCTARIRGGADTVGPDNQNYLLSENRATEVKKLLNKHFGLANERISTEPTGERALADATLDGVNALANRRVDVSIRCEP